MMATQISFVTRLQELSRRESNWDELGSKKPSLQSISMAQQILLDWSESVVKHQCPWITPFISSDEEGYITIEWHYWLRELHVNVKEDEAEITQIWGTNLENEMHVQILHKEDYLKLWTWLLDNAAN